MKGKAVIRSLRAASLVLMLATSMAAAQDYDAGLAAAQSGDFATALREWTPLAEQGDARAQYNLGIMYGKGDGVPQDDAEAVKWYRLAAAQGVAEAQLNLGFMYAKGNGVPQDYAEAVKWYRLAAAQGVVKAQFNLGFMYSNGQGVPQDDITAHMWFNLAAANGLPADSSGRDRVAAKMVAADIAQAQRRAKVCLASAYKTCD